MERADVITAVWGEAYLSFFLGRCLRSLLAPGNLPALASHADCRYQIHTDSAGAGRIEASPVIGRLRAILPVDIYIHTVQGGDIYAAVTALHEDAVRRAVERDAAILFVTPDFLFSNGSFASLLTIVEGGGRLILVCPPRLDQEKLAHVLSVSDGDDAIALPARQLVALGLACLHSITKLCFWDAGEFGSWPHHVFFEIPGRGLVARGFHMHPLLVLPTARTGLLGQTFDTAFVAHAVPDFSDVRVVTDSDQVMVFECSPPEKRTGGPVPLGQRVRFASQFIEQAAFRHHLLCSTEAIFIHHAELDGAVEREAVARSGAMAGLLVQRSQLCTYSLFLLDPLAAMVRARRWRTDPHYDIRRPGLLEALFLRAVYALGAKVKSAYKQFEDRGTLPDDDALWHACRAIPGYALRRAAVLLLLPMGVPAIIGDLSRGRFSRLGERAIQEAVGEAKKPNFLNMAFNHDVVPSAPAQFLKTSSPSPTMPNKSALELEVEQLRDEVKAGQISIRRGNLKSDTLAREISNSDIAMRRQLLEVYRGAAAKLLESGNLPDAMTFLTRAIDFAQASRKLHLSLKIDPVFGHEADEYMLLLFKAMHNCLEDSKAVVDLFASRGARACVLSTVVWGREYCDLFCDDLVPTLLAPGNLPAFAKKRRLLFQIVTTPTYKPMIMRSKSFEALSRVCEIQFILFPDTLLSEITYVYTDPRRWHVSGALHHVSILHAYRISADLITLPPDIVMSAGMFERIAALSERGFQTVMCTGPLVRRREFEDGMLGYRCDDGAVSIPGRDLSNLAIRSFHPLTVRTFPSPGIRNHLKGRVNLLWEVSGGLVSHAAHQHPLFISGEAWPPDLRFSYRTVDTDLVSRLFKPSQWEQRVYVVTNFDEMGFYNLSSGEPDASTQESLFETVPFAQNFWVICNEFNLWLFERKAVIRSDALLGADLQEESAVTAQYEEILDVVKSMRPRQPA